MKDIEYIRNCPDCGVKLTTNNKYYYRKAIRENKSCRYCSRKGIEFSEEHKRNLSKNHADVSGENNPFYNKSHKDETKRRISKIKKAQYEDPKLRKKLSESMKKFHEKNENSFSGKDHTDEVKEKLSFLSTKRFENNEERLNISRSLKKYFEKNDVWNKGLENPYSNDTLKKMSDSAKHRIMRHGNNQFHSYNPDSIPIIEKFGEENGYEFQHAENGGEYQVPGTTFFVDGYDEENNVVIEYDENYHFLSEWQIKKDKKRQDEIGNTLKCKFIRITETGKIKKFNYEN